MYAHDITHTLPIPAQPVTYRHNVHVQSLRTCLFSSDAAQWWPGLLGWTGPVGHGLDTTPRGRARFLRARGAMGVGWVAAYRRKDLVNLFHFSSDPTRSPVKAPLKSRRCMDTYGESEGGSRSTQGAVSLISSKKSLPVSEYTGGGTTTSGGE